MARTFLIFVSVAEASADEHAAALIRAARTLLPACRFRGLCGPRMRAAGAESIADMTERAGMLTGIFAGAGVAARVGALVRRDWQRQRPDLVLLLDSSVFHLESSPLHRGLAPSAAALGLPVLYYIAPQTWASRPRRNRLLARYVDRVACILPFEEAHFRAVGVRAEYVGHPLLESLADSRADPAAVARLRERGAPLVALLPGSRPHVIETMLPIQLRVLDAMRARGERFAAAVSCAAPRNLEQVRRLIREAAPASDADSAAPASDADSAAPVVCVDDNPSLLSACDLALVTSGTATLMAAYYRRPMIAMYHTRAAPPVLYRRFGRHFVRTPHLALPNLLAGRRIVPEFMPFVSDPAAVARVACDLLGDRTWRELMTAQLDRTVRALEGPRASSNVCRIIADMLGVPATGSLRGAAPG